MSRHELPHDSAAEQQILGCMLVYHDSHAEITASLVPADFYEPRHAAVFGAMAELYRTGKPVDIVTTMAHLKASGQQDKSDGMYLAELCETVATSATVGYYCRQVLQLARTRQLHGALSRLAGECLAPSADTAAIIGAAYQALDGANEGRHGAADDILTLDELARRYEAHVANLADNRFITGFGELDSVINGVSPGETLFITAYSGLGKSALLHNLLLNGCRTSGLHHLFFSLEMPATRVFERTVQIALGRYTYNIESEFHHHDRDKRAETMLDLAESGASRLLVCEKGGLNLEQVEHYARLARSRYGKLGAIGIDYLGLMAADGTRSEYERISAVAEGSKQLAKRLNVPVVVLTQISREAAKTNVIEMHSAKGSGAVEASADYLVALQKKDSQMFLKLLKNRNGEAGLDFVVDIKWSFLQFLSVTPVGSDAAREVQRGQQRARKSFGSGAYSDDDPFP